MFCSLTDTLFCTIWQKGPAPTAAFDHRVHLISSVILAVSQSYCWCSWGNEHPVKNGAENASALLHLSVSGQERSLLMTSFFKGSWQLMSLGPGRAAALCTETTLAVSPTPTLWLTFAHLPFQPEHHQPPPGSKPNSVRDEESSSLCHFHFLPLSSLQLLESFIILFIENVTFRGYFSPLGASLKLSNV